MPAKVMINWLGSVTAVVAVSVQETTAVTEPDELQASTSIVDVLCFGDNTGTITTTITGGITPYTYNWSNGSNNNSITNIVAGTYTVTVTDNNGATNTAQGIVNEPTDLTLTTYGTDATINGGSDGTATANVGGGTTAYAYTWSNGNSTQSISGLPAGSYTVTVVDANNCQEITNVAIGEPTTVIVSLIDIDVLCFGGNTGSVSSTVSGGVGNYTYNWSNGNTNSSISNMITGIYTVTVTDNNGATAVASTNITQPDNLTATVNNHDLECFGDSNGELSANVAGGTTDYAYNWSNGDATASTANLTAGTYTVTVTDANNCITTATAEVTQPANLTATVNNHDLECFGDSNGELSANVAGGTTDYAYNWSNGDATASTANLTAGTYTVTVTDANNCITTATAEVTQPDNLTATVNNHDLECFGDSNGELSANVAGGTTDYAYNWSNGDATASTANLTAGTYTVTVTDANNCITTATAEVTQPDNLTATVNNHDLECFGDSNGELSANVAGGTTDYAYNWSNGDATASTANLTAGTYTVTVTDANNCITTATAEVTQPDNLTATVNNHDLECFGDSNGELSANVAGGTIDYAYNWSNGDATASTANLTAGTYTVTVTDANNCITTATAEVTQPDNLTATVNNHDLECFGDSNGELSANVAGGTTDYAYNWSNGDATASTANLTAGTYTVTVTDANNCITTATAEVTQPANLTATVNNHDLECFGDSNGELSANVAGGTTDYAYNWSNGDATASTANLTAGTYTVTVTDANNCITTATAEVTQPANLTATVNNHDLECFGDSNGELSANVAGGTTDYAYNWSNGDATASTANLTAGTYTVTVTDANNCITTATAEVTQPDNLTATVNNHDLECFGDSNGELSANVAGGTTDYAYNWSNGDATASTANLTAGTYTVTVTDANNCITTATAEVTQPDNLTATVNNHDLECFGDSNGELSANVAGGTTDYAYNWSNGDATASTANLTAGTYTVTVTDANNCMTTATAEVTQPDNLTATVNNHDLECFGDSNGELSANVAGGTTDYAYNWSNGDATASTANLTAGTYTVTVTDANNCMTTATAEVTQPDNLTATVNNHDLECFGDSNGELSANVAGGTTDYAYNWSNGDATASTANLTAGTYTVTVTDANNCMTTATAEVTQPANLTATVNNHDLECFGDSNGELSANVAGGTTDYAYNWSNGDATASTANLTAGTYTVTVTDANNCMTTATAEVTQPDNLTATVNNHDLECFGDSNGELSANVAGGTTDYAYNWSNGDATASTANLTAGTYTVTVTDANNCMTTATAEVTQPANLTATVNNHDLECFGDSNGELSANVAGGTTDYAYNWSNGDATASTANLTAGTYTVTVTDANNCMTTATAEVTQPDGITLEVNATHLDCSLDSDGTGSAVAIGGTGSLTYVWSNGETTASINGLTLEDYTVTVTDANNCSATEQIAITSTSDCSALGNFVWLDIDGDGVQDSDENGIEGVKVELFASDGTSLGTTTTDENGFYLFGDLEAGDYYLVFTAPTGMETTRPNSGDDTNDSDADPITGQTTVVSLGAGELNETIDAGYYEPVNLGDFVWLDFDNDGEYDEGEEGIPDVPLKLFDADGNQIGTTTTDENGFYSFDNLPPGTYTVTVPTFGPNGESLTTPNNQTTTLLSGEEDLTLDFGYGAIVNSLGNYVWLDANVDGIQDDNENGIEGVEVTLFNADTNEELDSEFTDEDGFYLFTGLPDGNYYVVFGEVEDHFRTETNQTDEANDSDAGEDGRSQTVSLSGGENNLDIDAGYFENAWIGDFVWLDLDGDGEQDDEEIGIEGVTLTLFDEDGNELGTEVTDENGFYRFTGLLPGTYTVTISVTGPNGETITTPSTMTTTIAAGEHDDTLDFGYTPTLNSLGNYVWLDANVDGIQDDNENGIEGVEVTLFNADTNEELDSELTNEDGFYLFTSLPDGNYYVVFGEVEDHFRTETNQTDEANDSDAEEDGRSQTVSLSGGENNLDIDAGYFENAWIGDFVWLDLDGDGEQDDEEVGIEGVTLTLFDEDGNELGTEVTDENGFYRFTDLLPGTYTVTISVTGPNGETITTPSTMTTTIAAGEHDDTLDFGYTPVKCNLVLSTPNVSECFYNQNTGNSQATVTVTVSWTDAEVGDILRVTAASDSRNLPIGTVDGNASFEFLVAANGSFNTLSAEIESECGVSDFFESPDPCQVVNSLGNYVWLDMDGDGRQGNEEGGIEGVQVTLFNADTNNSITSTTTDENGFYLFDNLPDGNYFVVFGEVEDMNLTAPNEGIDELDSDAGENGQTPIVNLSGGANNLTLDAGYYVPVTIGDYIWLDLDGDGVQDEDENGLSGITVTLLDENGNVVATTTTNGNGNYTFENLPPGTYTVSVPAIGPNGETLSTPITVTFTLVSGETNLDYDFGYQPVFNSIGDFVWLDMDGDGFQDGGERGIEGVRVTLFDANTDAQLEVTATDVDGFYLFDELADGSYYVVFDEMTGMGRSDADQGGDDRGDSDADENGQSHTVDLAGGEDNRDVDAGYFEGAWVGDFVWMDVNGDGIQDEGEEGLEGVILTLFDEDGNVIGTTVTDQNGFYEFTGLAPGTYTVSVSVFGPNGESITTPNTMTTTVLSGEHDDTLDFGYQLSIIDPIVGALGDFVWIDQNGNGVQDAGDTGIQGVEVELFNANTGESLGTQTTGELGDYLFTGLEEGRYYVQFNLPEGYVTSPQFASEDFRSDSNADENGQSDVIILGEGEQNLTIDAGIYIPAQLGDTVWLDENGDGIQNNGELGMEGITVVLTDADGNVLATVETDENGNYLFDNLAPGTYTVIVPPALPTGEEPTTFIQMEATLNSGDSNLDLDFGYWIPPVNALGDTCLVGRKCQWYSR